MAKLVHSETWGVLTEDGRLFAWGIATRDEALAMLRGVQTQEEAARGCGGCENGEPCGPDGEYCL